MSKYVMGKAYVYFLKDASSRYYVGSTDNLVRRLKQHQNGHTLTTKRMNNPVLVLEQEYGSLTEARRVERRIKKLKRRDYLEKIIEDGFIR